jgi:aspartate beta-hydroxylase
LKSKPSWDGYYFYRHGERRNDNCSSCPQTSAMLDSISLCHVREHAPEAFFSVFAPGTHLLPHRGVTNTRVVGHLPLTVPDDCALRVGGEQHAWQEGRMVVFDDTYEHEAWNRSDRTRVVLIFDLWNPYLTEAERSAITDLVPAIGDLRKAIDKV